MLILSSLLTLISTKNAFATNCGVIGTTFPIAETDMRNLIQDRLATLQANGGLAHLQSQMTQNLASGMNMPKPVAGITSTTQPQTHYFDPTVRFSQAIYNAQGQQVLPAGTAYNPLSVVTMTETLLFYDGTNEAQIKWAKAEDARLSGHDKLILVNGSVVSQRQLFHKAVYFDQGGRLTGRFQIHHVPVLVSQAGNLLKIEEVLPA